MWVILPTYILSVEWSRAASTMPRRWPGAGHRGKLGAHVSGLNHEHAHVGHKLLEHCRQASPIERRGKVHTAHAAAERVFPPEPELVMILERETPFRPSSM